jgi:hypothetical protein
MAISFAASSSERMIGVATGALHAVNEGTICCWARPAGIVGSGVALVLSTNGSGGSSNGRLRLEQSGASWLARAQRLDADVSTTVSGGVAAAGTLVHLAAVATYNAALFRIFVDGVLVGTATPAAWTGATSATDSAARVIGSRPNASAGGFFDGAIDDARVYGRALSTDELLHIVAAKGRDGIIRSLEHRWTLDDGAPGNAITARGRDPRTAVLAPSNTPTAIEHINHSRRRRRAA